MLELIERQTALTYILNSFAYFNRLIDERSEIRRSTQTYGRCDFIIDTANTILTSKLLSGIVETYCELFNSCNGV